MSEDLYLIALGSNMRHRRFGRPRDVVESALGFIEMTGAQVVARSPVITSRPLGPSQRDYANAAALVRCPMPPLRMLAMLHGIELSHGRERRGARWRARILDLDIVLWSGGMWDQGGLTIPHPRFRERGFVLGPAAAIAPVWRDPVSGLSLAQLHARLTRPRRVPTSRACQTKRLGP